MRLFIPAKIDKKNNVKTKYFTCGKLNLNPEKYLFIPETIEKTGYFTHINGEKFYTYNKNGKDLVFFID